MQCDAIMPSIMEKKVGVLFCTLHDISAQHRGSSCVTVTAKMHIDTTLYTGQSMEIRWHRGEGRGSDRGRKRDSGRG